MFGAFFANLTPRGTIQLDDTVVVTLAQCLDLGHIKEDEYDPNTADNDATPGERQSAADRIGHETFDENDGLDVKIKISMDRQRIFALFKCSGVRIVPVPVCILLYLDLNFVLMVPVRYVMLRTGTGRIDIVPILRNFSLKIWHIHRSPVLWSRSILARFRLQLVKMAAPAPALAPALAL